MFLSRLVEPLRLFHPTRLNLTAMPFARTALRIVAIAGYDSSLRLASHNIQRTLPAIQPETKNLHQS